MKTIKIEKEVTKEDVYVVVDTNEKMIEVKEMLSSSNQRYLGRICGTANILVYDKQLNAWYKLPYAEDRQCEITVPQLAELLGVEYPLRKREEEKKSPTLQELIDAARKEIVKIDRRYPHWFEDDFVVPKFKTSYGREFGSEKEAIAYYVSRKVLEML